MSVLEELVARLRLDDAKFQSAIEKVKSSVSGMGISILATNEKIKRSFEAVEAAVKKIKVGIAYVTAAVGAFALTADNFNRIEARLTNVTKGTGELQSAMQALIDTTSKTGTSLEANVLLFQRIAQSKEALGATNAEMLQLVDTVAKLGIIGGSSVEDVNNATRQLAQALSAPRVQADELNSILDQMPLVAKAIEKEMGLLPGTIKEAVTAGKVLREDVFASLLNAADDANNKFAKMPRLLGQATTNMTTQVGLMIQKIDKAIGITSSLAKAFDIVGNFIKDNQRDIVILATDIFKVGKAINSMAMSLAGMIGRIFGKLLEEVLRVINQAVGQVNNLSKSANAFLAGTPIGFRFGQLPTAGVGAAQRLVSNVNDSFRGGYTAPSVSLGGGGGRSLSRAIPSKMGLGSLGGGSGRGGGAGKGGGAVSDVAQVGRFINGQLKTSASIEGGVVEQITKPLVSALNLYKQQIDVVETDLSKAINDYFGNYKKQLDEADKINQKNMSTLDQEAELRLRLNELMDLGLITQQTYTQELDAFHSSLKQQKDSISGLEVAVRQWGRAFEDSFIGSIKTGKFEFKNMVGSILEDLARITIQQKITGPLGAAFGGAIKSKGFGGLLSSAFGGIKSILGFASGGVPPVGKPSIVGENGPELFVPNQVGRVMPNGSMGGEAINVTQVFNIKTTDPNFVKAVLQSEMSNIKRSTEEGIVAAIARGRGPITRAVGGRA